MTQVLVWSHYQKEAKLKPMDKGLILNLILIFWSNHSWFNGKFKILGFCFFLREMYVKLILTDEEGGEIKE